MKIIPKFILIIAIMSFVPISITAFWGLTKTEKIITNKTAGNFFTIADLTADKVIFYFEKQKIRTTDWSLDAYIRSEFENILQTGDEQKINELTEYIQTKKHPLDPAIGITDILDLSGKVIISTNKDRIGKNEKNEDIAFDKTLKAEFGETFISGPAIEEDELGGMPMFHITTPIISLKTNQNIGVLLNHITNTDLEKLLSEELITDKPSRETQSAFATAEIYLVNKNGLMISSSKFIPNAVLNQKVDTESVKKCINNGENFWGDYLDYRQIQVIGASSCPKDQPWMLIVEVDKEEALALINSLRLNIFAAAILALLSSATASWFLLYNLIIKRIKNISRSIEQTKEDLQYSPIKVKADDELGIIEKNINNLYEKIKTFVKEAEKLKEQKYKNIIDSLPICIKLFDEKGKMTFLNKNGIKEHFLKTEEEALKWDYMESIDSTFRDLIKESVKKAFAGETIKIQFKHTPKGSSNVWDEAWIVPLKNDKDEIEGIVFSSEDITTQKNLEENLMREKEAVKNYLDIAGVMIIAIDKNLNVKMINKKGCEILGYEEKEIIGKNWFENFIPQKNREEIKLVFNRLIKKELKPMEYHENTVLTKSGKEKIIAWYNALIINEKGEVAGTLSSGEDITERKKMESEIGKIQEQYKNIIDSLPICIKLFDEKGKMVFINKYGMDEHFLKTEEEAQKWNYLDTVQEEFKEGAKAKLDEALKDNNPVVEFKHTPEGSTHEWCQGWFTPIKDNAGKITGTIMASVDITERKQIQEKTKELGELKNKFIQIVSHQMRTPLNAIRWGLETILNKTLGKITKDQESMIKTSYDSALEIIDRIDDLITALEIEEGRIKLELQEGYIDSLTDSIVIQYEPKIRIKKMKLTFIKPKIRSPLNIDTAKIQQVIAKLLDNAVKYTHDGGEININIEEKDNEVYFTISDSGIGIPADDQKKIFSKFYRASNAILMLPDSSGLGLFISKSFIEGHGGKLWFNSREGVGSVFYFKLPVKK